MAVAGGSDDEQLAQWRETQARLGRGQRDATEALNAESDRSLDSICVDLARLLVEVVNDRKLWTLLDASVVRLEHLTDDERLRLRTLSQVDWAQFLISSGYESPPPPSAENYAAAFRGSVNEAIAGTNRVDPDLLRVQVFELAGLLDHNLATNRRRAKAEIWRLQVRNALPAVAKVAVIVGVAAAVGTAVGLAATGIGAIPAAGLAAAAVSATQSMLTPRQKEGRDAPRANRLQMFEPAAMDSVMRELEVLASIPSPYAEGQADAAAMDQFTRLSVSVIPRLNELIAAGFLAWDSHSVRGRAESTLSTVIAQLVDIRMALLGTLEPPVPLSQLIERLVISLKQLNIPMQRPGPGFGR